MAEKFEHKTDYKLEPKQRGKQIIKKIKDKIMFFIMELSFNIFIWLFEEIEGYEHTTEYLRIR